jgi:hypothetical protein
MRKLTVLGAAVILASTAALASTAQAASCAQYDPTCATYPMPSNTGTSAPAATRSEARATTSYQRHPRSAYRAERDRYRSAYRAERAPGPGEVAGGVVGGAVGTAGAITAGAVNTAGAIATAPFRPMDSYAYYNGPYNGGWNQQSYAERNGFACTPGTYFMGPDGRRHPCQ